MNINEMIWLDWFDQCVLRLDFANEEIEKISEYLKITRYYPIQINNILANLRSPIDYSISAVKREVGYDDGRTNFPFKQENQSIQSYKKTVNTMLGVCDDELINILLSIQKHNDVKWFDDLNKIYNKDKHQSIVTLLPKKYQKVEGGRGFFKFSFEFEGDIAEDFVFPNFAPAFLPNGLTLRDFKRHPSYQSHDIVVFQYNQEPIYDFLKEVLEGVNEFIIDIKEYIENKKNLSSDSQEN